MTQLTREMTLQTVFNAIGILNETLPSDRQLPLSEETLLFGLGATLNSMALVRLIVEVEQLFFEDFNLEITLVNEKALSQKRSPFRRVRSLTDYIYSLVDRDREY